MKPNQSTNAEITDSFDEGFEHAKRARARIKELTHLIITSNDPELCAHWADERESIQNALLSL